MNNATNILGAFAARRLGDGRLFERAVRGDAAAFSEVYRRYEKRVYGFCLARSLDREAAADATQEVFMRLLKAAPGSVDHPRAWLFAVARNVVIDAIRKRARLHEDGEANEDTAAWATMTTADTADEVVARADAEAAFLGLRRMRPRYRTALILREIHGQSSADIAEAMGVASSGAVDTLLSRARDAFGVAYAAVSELPQVCRRNVELMYRARGSGINPQEAAALQAHLASCDRCRREDARASDPKRLSALLPLLVPAGAAASSLLGRAALASRSLPDVSVTQHVVQFVQTHLQTVGARLAVGVVAATLVAVPIVAVKATHHDQLPAVKSVAHSNPLPPVGLVYRPPSRAGMGAARAAFMGSLRTHSRRAGMTRAAGSMAGRVHGVAAASHRLSMTPLPRGAKGTTVPSMKAKSPAAGAGRGKSMGHSSAMH